MSYNNGKNNPRYSHGLSNTPTYKTWADMMQRCNNPKARAYKYYGARGIKISKRWQTFSNFYKDMGEREEGLTLERVDNNKGYNSKNCKWATMKEQSKNKRAGGHKILTPLIVKKIRAQSSIKTQQQLADEYKISQSTISEIQRSITWKSL